MVSHLSPSSVVLLRFHVSPLCFIGFQVSSLAPIRMNSFAITIAYVHVGTLGPMVALFSLWWCNILQNTSCYDITISMLHIFKLEFVFGLWLKVIVHVTHSCHPTNMPCIWIVTWSSCIVITCYIMIHVELSHFLSHILILIDSTNKVLLGSFKICFVSNWVKFDLNGLWIIHIGYLISEFKFN